MLLRPHKACWLVEADVTGDHGRGLNRSPWWLLLLLIPFITMLWVPSYAGGSPDLAGVPFFYWYQFLWVLITAVITVVVYRLGREV